MIASNLFNNSNQNLTFPIFISLKGYGTLNQGLKQGLNQGLNKPINKGLNQHINQSSNQGLQSNNMFSQNMLPDYGMSFKINWTHILIAVICIGVLIFLFYLYKNKEVVKVQEIQAVQEIQVEKVQEEPIKIL